MKKAEKEEFDKAKLDEIWEKACQYDPPKKSSKNVKVDEGDTMFEEWNLFLKLLRKLSQHFIVTMPDQVYDQSVGQ